MTSLPELTYVTPQGSETITEELGRVEAQHYQDGPDYITFIAPFSQVIASATFNQVTVMREPLVTGASKWRDGRQTTLVFSVDDRGGEEISPVETAYATEALPHESSYRLPKAGLHALVNHFAPPQAVALTETLQAPHTHRSIPTAGSEVSERTKAIFRVAQYPKSNESIPPIQRRPLDPKETSTDDNVYF